MQSFPDIPAGTLVGLMSGTSVDAVDACCVRFFVENHRPCFEVLATHTHPIPEDLRQAVLALAGASQKAPEMVLSLDKRLGELFAETVLGLMQAHALAKDKIDAIGSHGQTIDHQPPKNTQEKGTTWQIGDPKIIAAQTGFTTVADFRQADMAVYGQGAPLVCFADYWLLGNDTKTRCVQNIGGIGNVTVLPAGQATDAVFAFDTGPGNMLLDLAMMRFYNQPFDKDATVARTGTVQPEVLDYLLSHPYFTLAPPKSTGRELFGQPFLEDALRLFPTIPPADWLATLTAFTAESIVDAYRRFVFPITPVDEVIVGGGGAKNPLLLEAIHSLLKQSLPDVKLKPHEAYGIDSQYKEAMAFAMLAWATLHQIPNNLPACTGAREPVVLGKVFTP